MEAKRVFILGIGPIPLDNPEFMHGTCWRSWQLTRALLDDGHDVFLICFRVVGTPGAKDRSANKDVREGRLRYVSLTEAEFVHLPLIRRYYDEYGPDCVVGANTYPASILAQIDPEAPFWADINGYYMGEAQAKAARHDDDDYVKHSWDIQLPVLFQADRFSVASTPQKSILIGELDLLGRLNRHTFGYEFAGVIPNGREPTEPRSAPPQVRGRRVPVDAFLALWLGGYNFWYDMDTLFAGLERAMERNPRLHYVSTGGSIEGQDDVTFTRLREKIATSPHRERFHFLGWVPWDRLDACCRECDVGVNVDADCYEVRFGARNRITDMMRLGLPVVTTVATEITEVVARERCGWGCPLGDPEGLAQALLEAADRPEEVRRRGDNASRYFARHYTAGQASRCLREWVAGPLRKAPDWRRPNAAGWPLPVREADLARMSAFRRLAYRYAKYGARGLAARLVSPEKRRKRIVPT